MPIAKVSATDVKLIPKEKTISINSFAAVGTFPVIG
jgi:hypothetical protein